MGGSEGRGAVKEERRLPRFSGGSHAVEGAAVERFSSFVAVVMCRCCLANGKNKG